MEIGRRITLAVDTQWYKTVEAHNFLQESQTTEHLTDLLIGVIESDDAVGVWIKPDERFSESPRAHS